MGQLVVEKSDRMNKNFVEDIVDWKLGSYHLCPTCGKMYNSNHSLVRHEKDAHDIEQFVEKRFLCENSFCNEAFTTATTRDCHQRTHKSSRQRFQPTVKRKLLRIFRKMMIKWKMNGKTVKSF